MILCFKKELIRKKNATHRLWRRPFVTPFVTPLCICRYTKKVYDEYPWTQAVPDDPPQRYPQYPQNDAENTPENTPKDFLFKAPRTDF